MSEKILPNIIWAKIFENLDLKNTLSVSIVCKTFHHICQKYNKKHYKWITLIPKNEGPSLRRGKKKKKKKKS